MKENEKNKLVVIKYGGHALDEDGIKAAFCQELADLVGQGVKFVIVHGGGPQINDLLNRLHIESRFVNGLRVTDARALAVVEMALCATVNKELVRNMLRNGLDAVGISGEDSELLLARRLNPELEFVGEVTKVQPRILLDLLKDGYLPILAPLGLDENFDVLNINADTAAGAVAGALQADYFVLVSDVPGVKDGEGRLFSYLAKPALDEMLAAGVITGGMIPKIESCFYALEHGCKSTIILDGSRKNGLKDLLLAGKPHGTVINL